MKVFCLKDHCILQELEEADLLAAQTFNLIVGTSCTSQTPIHFAFVYVIFSHSL